MAWEVGNFTLGAGASATFTFTWSAGGYPGCQVIIVKPGHSHVHGAGGAGQELRYTNPGVRRDHDGKTRYRLTVTNLGSAAVEYGFCGSSI